MECAESDSRPLLAPRSADSKLAARERDTAVDGCYVFKCLRPARPAGVHGDEMAHPGSFFSGSLPLAADAWLRAPIGGGNNAPAAEHATGPNVDGRPAVSHLSRPLRCGRGLDR